MEGGDRWGPLFLRGNERLKLSKPRSERERQGMRGERAECTEE